MSFTQQNIIDVRNSIARYIVKTPVLRFDFIDRLCGCNVFFKCENFQHTGSFKYRAAINAIKNISPESNNKGVIINATIGGGKAPNAGSLPTTVTRSAGINLTKSLANEYAKDNIRVNTICIGLIKSAQWDRKSGSGNVDDLYIEMAKKVPMGKVGEEIDYANLVAFLSSDRSAYITGTAINLDGGLCPVV